MPEIKASNSKEGKVRSFQEFSQEGEAQNREGRDKYRVEQILNENIVIENADIRKSNRYNREYAAVHFYPENTRVPSYFITSSGVLLKQFKRYKQYMPFRCTIQKQKRYYTLAPTK